MEDLLHPPPSRDEVRHDALRRLHRIEGQVRGIGRMVEDDRSCVDMLTQLGAATRALQAVALVLLDDHLRHCLLGPARELPAHKVDEASEAIARLIRS